MPEEAFCPHCGAPATSPMGPHGYPGVTGYEYITFACGGKGTRARDNGQFAYTGEIGCDCPILVARRSRAIDQLKETHGFGHFDEEDVERVIAEQQRNC